MQSFKSYWADTKFCACFYKRPITPYKISGLLPKSNLTCVLIIYINILNLNWIHAVFQKLLRGQHFLITDARTDARTHGRTGVTINAPPPFFEWRGHKNTGLFRNSLTLISVGLKWCVTVPLVLWWQVAFKVAHGRLRTHRIDHWVCLYLTSRTCNSKNLKTKTIHDVLISTFYLLILHINSSIEPL